ncbi:GTS1 Protein GTS1 [Candida maltosa Xu316]|uniref:Ultradian oscillation regulator, putative n=1 Tax=Candida maltosa (strain Xu316) TaxID=1245528 RepID=M3JYV1_CANMX|nr:Ultradian oscillation regulator, putative [Candida maltosa Xu316]
MSRKSEKEKSGRLIEIVNSNANRNKCGECGAPYPTWASYNIGILLCGRCSSLHKRILGPPNQNVSKVKSLTLDSWTDSQIDHLQRVGNRRANKKWNSKRIPFPYDGDDDVSAVEQYLRDKYINGKFRDDNIETSDYDDRFSKFSGGAGGDDDGVYSSRTSLRSRSSSMNIPKLTHRKLTTFEYTQYGTQAMKIRSYGFNDQDAVLESLLLSSGNIELALDILEQDAKINPHKDEIAPQLPRRPAQPQPSTTTTTNTAPSASSGGDWWNGQTTTTQQQQQQPGVVSPQIYQYTDPVTGQISYIDSNGQEYLDPNNPQHQQQLMQMNNPQLVAQQTNKQSIMSLYNQPTNQPQQQPQQQFTGYVQQPQFTGFGQPQQPQFTGFGQPQQQNPYGQQGYWRPQ